MGAAVVAAASAKPEPDRDLEGEPNLPFMAKAGVRARRAVGDLCKCDQRACKSVIGRGERGGGGGRKVVVAGTGILVDPIGDNLIVMRPMQCVIRLAIGGCYVVRSPVPRSLK